MLIQKTFKRDRRNAIQTAHASIDRAERLTKVFKRINQDNVKLLDCFYVDKQHENGPEIHSVYSTGDILIHNASTEKLITGYLGTHRQLTRYYAECKIPSKF